MKNASVSIGLLLMMSCAEQSATEGVAENEVVAEAMYFGEKIDEAGAIGVEELYTQLETEDSVHVKFSTTIMETCTKKGCWMTVNLEDGKDMMVRFKDYGFFVPLEGMEGKSTIFEGYAYTDSVSIEELQHYAFDAGDDSATVAAITEHEVALTFLASGVIIKN
jgi:hypothetical protein